MGTLPTALITDTPAIGVCINQEYLPFIIGSLEVLTIPDYWLGADQFAPAQIEKLIAILAGEPSADCTASEAPGTWCHEWNFTLSDGGWTADIYGGQYLASYNFPFGWGDNYPPGYDGIYIISPHDFPERAISSVLVQFSSAWGGTNPRIYIQNADGSITYATTNESGSINVLVPFSPAVNMTSLKIVADPRVGDFENTDLVIQYVRVCGFGSDPFVA